MKDVIFYGAGKWLMDHYERLIKEYRPICICDVDEKKHGKKLFGEVKVISPQDARGIYPNAEYLVTLKNGANGYRLEAIDHLINKYGIDKKKILNYEAYYYGYGCYLAQNALLFHHDRLMNCCENPKVVGAPYALYNREKTLDDIVDMKRIVQERIRNFKHLRIPLEGHSVHYSRECGDWEYNLDENSTYPPEVYCVHCHEIRKGYFSTNHFVIDYMQLASNSDSVCNFKCPYCCEAMPGYVPKSEKNITENIIRTLTLLKKSKSAIELDNSDLTFTIATGEPAMYHDLEKVTSVIDNAYYQILTNASIYSGVIQNLIRYGEIVISLDAGTAETFKKIKGIDCYEKVKKNLRRYRKYGSIVPKFIIQPGINDNEKDINGFVDFCKSIDPLRVEVVRDWISDEFDRDRFNYNEETMRVVARLLQKLEDARMNIRVVVFPSNYRETLNNYL